MPRRKAFIGVLTAKRREIGRTQFIKQKWACTPYNKLTNLGWETADNNRSKHKCRPAVKTNEHLLRGKTDGRRKQ
ncbi:hypothetical protein D3C80_1154990 [compost metagenome]